MRARRTLAAVVVGLLATGTALATTTATAAGSPRGPAPSERTVSDGKTTFTVFTNPGGATLSYVPGGRITLLRERTDSGELAFKDMNANGRLDAWEDWRKTPDERAKALAQELTIPQIEGSCCSAATNASSPRA